jgi:iron complex outermembrane receptor protein
LLLAGTSGGQHEYAFFPMIDRSTKVFGSRRMVSTLFVACLFPVMTVSADEKPDAMEPLVVEATSVARGGEGKPISPTFADSVSAERIRALDIMTAREAIEWIPNVAVSQGDSARASSFSVRSSQEIRYHELTGGRTGVGYYIDGIPCSDAYGRDLTMFAVDEFSFYKGPHGTSFGVPHSMGVIDVVTRAPGPVAEGEASYTYGSHELHQGLAHLSGPIQPNLFLGLDGMISEDEGWFEDRLTGDAYGKHGIASGRARLRWLPTEHLEINFIAGLDHHDDDPVIYVPADRTRDRYEVYSSPDAYASGGQNYQSIQALWKADGWQVKSITSHRDSEFDDYDPALLLNVFSPGSLPRTREQDVTSWSQEIRVESSDPEAELRWRTGMFLGWSESTLDHFILGLGPREGGDRFVYNFDDYAVYGEATRALGEKLDLSAGLRLQTTRDHTTSDFRPTPLAESLGSEYEYLEGWENFSAALPMAGATWKWTETQWSYFRFSTGMQPGGLAIAAVGSGDYASERSYHYELGHDSSLDDDTVQLRAAAFYTAYRDYQSFQFNPAGQTIFNADRAHALGVEGEIRARPCEGIELSAAAGYTYARFDDFDSPIGDFSGKHIDSIPSASVNLACAYHAPWGGMARLDWRYLGDTWFDVGNTVRQEAYVVMDAKIGYERGGFGVYVFARNLLDEEYLTHAYLFQGEPAATLGVPRMVGMEMRARF